MRWQIRGSGKSARKGLSFVIVLACLGVCGLAQGQKFSVPTGPPRDANSVSFRDNHYGVRFQVPPGWTFTLKDREISTFRLDARSAPPASEMRAVASMSFNPFPQSVLSGALVYFSVARHVNDRECAAQAAGTKAGNADAENIGGMTFVHGHDEHGGICVEARDEVYTAYRRGSCYRFDLAVNTFCAVSSGAAELSREQMRSLEARMAGILSTVSLDWEKTGPRTVPVPDVPGSSEPRSAPRRRIPATSSEHRPVLGVGA